MNAFRTRTRKLLATMLIAATAVTVASGFTPLGPTRDAGAMEIGPSTTFARTMSASLICNTNHNQVRLSIGVTVPPQGQWVRFRYYLSDGRTGNWSSWVQRPVYRSVLGVSSLVDHTWNVWDASSWSAYVEVQWWNGNQWTNHIGLWAQRFQALYSYRQAGLGCYT